MHNNSMYERPQKRKAQKSDEELLIDTRELEIDTNTASKFELAPEIKK